MDFLHSQHSSDSGRPAESNVLSVDYSTRSFNNSVLQNDDRNSNIMFRSPSTQSPFQSTEIVFVLCYSSQIQ